MVAKLHKVPPPVEQLDWAELTALAKARNELQEATGLEGRYLDLKLADYKPRTQRQHDALRACSAYVGSFDWTAHEGAGLWLLGPCGTGKSHLAAGIVRALYDNGEDVYFTSPRSMVRRFRATWGKTKADDEEDEPLTEADLLNIYGRDLPLLVLDDVGAWAGTDAELLLLGELLDLRSTHRKPTIITSNLTEEELQQSIGDRSFDRLREGAQILIVDGESMRKEAR